MNYQYDLIDCVAFEKILDGGCSGLRPLQPPPSSQPGAGEVIDYPATQEELLILARYWYKEHLDSQVMFFLDGCTSASESWQACKRIARLARIEAVVGQAALAEIIEQVRDAERRSLGEERWRIFVRGSATERDRVRDAYYREHKELDEILRNEILCQSVFERLCSRPTDHYSDPELGHHWFLTPHPIEGSPPGLLVLAVETPNGVSRYMTKYQVTIPVK